MTSISKNGRGAARARREGVGMAKLHGAMRIVRQAIWAEQSTRAGEHGHLLRLALNEAEALAGQTPFPELFFPELAVEKARALRAWSERQETVRRASAEMAFAE